ncbi:MAG TPA: DUF1501 domain-containing protein [Steroidobacteraceae bacterium]|jgi:uncharacterized protein (DUF1501 family)|nr:DUF1501 domain-containing protein [Steroidobacteraceae bacterium]
MKQQLSRRSFLETSLFAGAGTIMASRLAFANAPTDARFVFVLLRGALDGLSAVPPVGDPEYAGLRGQIALARSGEGAALPLEGPFALHPSLSFLHRSFAAKELAVLHAVASPYRERSHFDAQNVLESGELRPQGSTSGWINRALMAMPANKSREAGVALGANVPLAMRGAAEVASWSPTRIAALDDATLARITDMYARDPLLSQRLADALDSDAIASEAQAAGDEAALTMSAKSATPVERDAKEKRNYGARYVETARAAAGFLKRDDGPRVAMFDTTGWDTHANEGGAQGQLALRLRGLDAALAALKESLGPVWRNTVVLVATEFGRTAAINGTRGTDHGTGAAAFLLGGAVAGGRVLADWPGLARSNLLENRDLKPTRDLRTVMKGVLRDHLGLSATALDNKVFPDSANARPMDGLVRA